MGEVEKRIQFIKKQVGEDGLRILEEEGIRVDDALNSIIADQVKQGLILRAEVIIPNVKNMMTSELAYFSNNLGDDYGLEYVRRLKLMGFTDEMIAKSYSLEKETISLKEDLARKNPWVQRYFISCDSTPENIPKIEELTLSELILITDDANSAFSRDHHYLPNPAWNAVCITACCVGYTEARYVNEAHKRAKTIGWTEKQISAFTKNECMLTARLKWGYDDKPAWTEETVKV
jgi:hypothetical protein